MIISRTPFRVSFAGGGTDLKQFYQHEYGAVISTAIDKYMYITVNDYFDDKIILKYSKTEIVNTVDEIKHEIIREALKLLDINCGIEITSMADIPAKTGLGSSSSFTVGLLNALYAYKNVFVSAERLAREACEIEINILNGSMGKQDQYIAAYGGLQFIRFNPDETVFVDPVICSKEVKESLNENLMMFYTGVTREASTLLEKQAGKTKEKIDVLTKMKRMAEEMKQIITDQKNLGEFANCLHDGWMLKKEIIDDISSDYINGIYSMAMGAGAIGGKILGAGGGGFLLLFVKPRNQNRVRKALSDFTELPFSFEPQGSKIIYVGN